MCMKKMSLGRYVAPCHNCEKRYPGCHSKCEAYKEYDAKNEAVRKERELVALSAPNLNAKMKRFYKDKSKGVK